LLRWTHFVRRWQLAFPDHVHEFDAGKCRRGRTKGLEPQHRPYQPLDGSMILFDDVVEVFDLADLDACLSFGMWLSIAAVLAPLLSIVIFSGVPFLLIALRKNLSAAWRSAGNPPWHRPYRQPDTSTSSWHWCTRPVQGDGRMLFPLWF
jgi:hypothetical protein